MGKLGLWLYDFSGCEENKKTCWRVEEEDWEMHCMQMRCRVHSCVCTPADVFVRFSSQRGDKVICASTGPANQSAQTESGRAGQGAVELRESRTGSSRTEVWRPESKFKKQLRNPNFGDFAGSACCLASFARSAKLS